MYKTNTMKKASLFLVLSIFLFNCSPEDGEDGAIGPQGEQGIAGLNGQDGNNGEQGPQGEQGETGTANVIYSSWIANNFPEPPILDNRANFTIEIPELTDEIKNSGLIQVYARRPSGPDIYAIAPLPIIILEPVNEYYSFEYNSFNNNLTIRLAATDDLNINFFIYREFRYIIIPGGVATSGKTSKIDYAKMSYEEITEHFNIPE